MGVKMGIARWSTPNMQPFAKLAFLDIADEPINTRQRLSRTVGLV